MFGAILNAAGIIIGSAFGLFARKQPAAATQNYLKVALGCATIFYGGRLIWLGLNGSLWQVAGQFTIALLALILGRLAGRSLRIQKISNHLGQKAREQISRAVTRQSLHWSDGFNTCAILFCAAPLAVVGSVADGLGDQFQPLLVKAVMDGLAALGFAVLFRWSVALAALPVLAYQGALTLVCQQYARPVLEQHGLLDPVIATDGLLLVFISLVIFEVRKIELADYLPAIAVAPLLTWFWRGMH